MNTTNTQQQELFDAFIRYRDVDETRRILEKSEHHDVEYMRSLLFGALSLGWQDGVELMLSYPLVRLSLLGSQWSPGRMRQEVAHLQRKRETGWCSSCGTEPEDELLECWNGRFYCIECIADGDAPYEYYEYTAGS